MCPCTLPFTITVLLLISARTSAFSPIVRTPSTELTSPSKFPSKKNSFANLIDPLISMSFERLFLFGGGSAITGVGCVTFIDSASIMSCHLVAADGLALFRRAYALDLAEDVAEKFRYVHK